jgi:molecular chaperone DnaJ
MANKDYYQILGVNKQATDAEIKSAFRQAARKYHPDVYKGADREDKFKEINEAYQVLGDPNKKRQFDQFGTVDGFDFGGGGGAGGFSGFGDIFSNFGDVFEGFGFEGFGDIFGGARGSSSRRGQTRSQGEDLRVDVTITLDEASKGAEKVISIRKFEKCSKCRGTGSKDGKDPETCKTCGGRGEVRQTRQSFLGTVSTVSVCPNCRGEGRVISTPCSECSGAGRVAKTKEISIKIPAGIRSGSKLRISGEGNIGQRNGINGDLFVFVNVSKHSVFDRDGDDLYMKKEISFAQASLGTTIEIQTLFGKVDLKVPAGTQPSSSFRLKGKGMPHLGRSGQGDLYVIISIGIPKSLSNEERLLLAYLAEQRGEKTELSGKQGNIKEKLKKIL